MRINKKYITEEFRKEYDVNALVKHDNYIYCEIRKGMYGLKETGIIAYQNLMKNLAP